MGIELIQPTAGATNWATPINANWQSLENSIQLSPGNALINARFDFWQRGSSFTSDGYTADRWRYTKGTGGTPAFTVSRESFSLGQTDVPYEPKYYLRAAQSANATSTQPVLEQRIESVRTFANREVTLSFYARSGSGGGGSNFSVTPRIRQNFGTGGSPSAAVDTDASPVTITGTFQKFSVTLTAPAISSKTLGTDNNDYLGVLFVLPLSSTFILEIADVQLEPGVTATPIFLRFSASELALCQRYCYVFQTSNANDWAPVIGQIVTASAAQALMFFPVSMRTRPILIATASEWSGGEGPHYATLQTLAIYTTNSTDVNPASTLLQCVQAGSTWTPSGAFQMYSTSSAPKRLIFDAEL